MSGGTARGTRRERLLAFTWVGHLPLALDGARLVSIDAPDDDDDESLDVFEVFGVACPFSRGERRVARLAVDQGPERSLLLGDRVELGAVLERDVLSAPPFLAGLRARSGLLGFVSFAGTLFSLFDPARVTRPGDVSPPVPSSSS